MRGNIFSPESLLSNGIALILLILAIRKPVACRLLLCFIFIGASFLNTFMAINHPDRYLIYGELAALSSYEQLIMGAFSRHITTYVLMIAAVQFCIGIFLTSKGKLLKASLASAAIFLIAIAPLGAGSAFPCTLLLAAACLILLFKHTSIALSNIWLSKIWK